MESESKILIPIFIARLVIAGILLFLSIIQLSATTNAKKRLVLILNVFYILSMILYLLNPLEPLGCTYLLVTSHLPTLFGIIEITYLTELVLVAAKRIDRLYESTPDGHAKGLRVAGCLLVLLMLIQMITVGVTDTEAATLILEMAIIIYSLILVFYSVQAICNMRSSLRDLIVLMNATQQDMGELLLIENSINIEQISAYFNYFRFQNCSRHKKRVYTDAPRFCQTHEPTASWDNISRCPSSCRPNLRNFKNDQFDCQGKERILVVREPKPLHAQFSYIKCVLLYLVFNSNLRAIIRMDSNNKCPGEDVFGGSTHVSLV